MVLNFILEELANLADQGDETAKTAIRIIKQAKHKAQKYSGKLKLKKEV